MSKKWWLDFWLLAHVFMILVIIGIIGFIMFRMTVYMNLNNWDIRCIFVQCKSVKLLGGEE